MFGLFKKPDPQIAKEKPYEPEKPVRDLFEAVKDNAESFSYETAGGDSFAAIKFEFMGKEFGAFKVFGDLWALDVILIDDGYDREEFNWMTRRELRWLFFSIEEHLKRKEEARQKAKRQEFIDALCPDSST